MKQAILSVSNPEGREIMAPMEGIEGAGLVEAVRRGRRRRLDCRQNVGQRNAVWFSEEPKHAHL